MNLNFIEKYSKEYQPHRSGFFSLASNLVAMLVLIIAPFVNFMGLALLILVLCLEKNSGMVRRSALFSLLLWCVESIWLFVVQVITGSVGVIFYSHFSPVTMGAIGIVQSFLFSVPSLLVLAVVIYSAIRAYRWKAWNLPFLENLPFIRNLPKVLYDGDGPVPEACDLQYKG